LPPKCLQWFARIATKPSLPAPRTPPGDALHQPQSLQRRLAVWQSCQKGRSSAKSPSAARYTRGLVLETTKGYPILRRLSNSSMALASASQSSAV
jgi:hypothetical protein